MEQKKAGLVHLYCGDGKGKTTAAAGLAARAAGAGLRVIFAQFFKNGSSSEVKSLRRLETVRTMHCRTVPGRYSKMDEAGRARAREDYGRFLEEVIAASREDADLLVLDEAVSACNHGILQERALTAFLLAKPPALEVVLTGRSPSQELMELADYITEMRKIKHPYDQGVRARRGIEF